MNREDDVPEGGFDGHERAQRRRLSMLPLAEKLRWLEEADELVRHLHRARQPAVRERGVETGRGAADEPLGRGAGDGER